MAFDEQRYLREVLEPARQAGGTPPEDLRVRYQIDESAGAAQIAETVGQVRQCWRRTRGRLAFKRLVDRLEAEHTALVPVFEAAADGDLRPLRAALAASAKRSGGRLEEVRTRLGNAAGRLRMITPELLATIAGSAGVSGPEARELAAALGLDVREPDPLPETSPYPGYDAARDALAILSRRHLAHFVYGERCADLRVLDEVSVPRGRPIAEELAAIQRENERRSRGPETVGTDTVLAALRSCDAGALIRYDLVARLRLRSREHSQDDTLLRHATDDLNLAGPEARRLVHAVRNERGVTVGRLRQLIDAGEILAAVDFADALTDEAITEDLAELVRDARARLARAVQLRDEALSAADPDQAWVLLEDALRRVPGLPGARELLARLAPRPSGAPRAEVRDATVTLTWRPSPSRAGVVSYDVSRDGVPVTSTDDCSARDEPPVNVPVTYTVTARRGAAGAAAVASRAVVVRPEPQEVRLSAGDGVVTGRWVLPPEASRVVLTRDGRPVASAATGFRDRDVRNGTAHTYLVAAAYPGPGGESVTPGVSHTVVPQARPEPIADFTIEPGGQGLLVLRFAEPPAGQVEFLALEGPPPWPPGATLSVAEVRRAGEVVPATPTGQLTGQLTGHGQVIRLGRASAVLLAVTVAGDLATVGVHREHVNLAPITGLTAQRRGAAVFAGFDWPPEVAEVEVSWGERRIQVSAATYRAQGGIRLAAPESEPLTVGVAPVALLRGERLVGPGASVTLPGVLPVHYDLRVEGPMWNRSLAVELTCERPLRLARLVLVLKPGLIQPRSGDDGSVLAEWTGLEVPARLVLPAPRRARPYWLRCFTDDDVELVDPPVRRMKAG